MSNASAMDYVSSAAQAFSARICKAPVEVRARLRDRYEYLCEKQPGYMSDTYNHVAEHRAMANIEAELKNLGL